MDKNNSSWIKLQAKTLPGYAYGSVQPALVARVSSRIVEQKVQQRVNSALTAIFASRPFDRGQVHFVDAAGTSLLPLLVESYYRAHGGIRCPVYPWQHLMTLGSKSPALWENALLVIHYWSPDMAKELILWSQSTIELLLRHPQQERQVLTSQTAALDQLRRKFQTHGCQGINTVHLLRKAAQLGVRASNYINQIYRLGDGCHARLFRSTVTCKTSGIGIDIARRKSHTGEVLTGHGIPVPTFLVVTTAEEALQAAQTIGYPLVIKPDDTDGGIGVNAGISTEEQFLKSYAEARNLSQKVLVQQFVRGLDYRITVVEGKVVKVILRHPGGVRGDGHSTVTELMAIVQASPRHQAEHLANGRFSIDLDHEALDLLAEAGLTPESVPAEGIFLPLRRKANVSTGGEQVLIDPTRLHPDNLLLACRCAAVLRLNIAGVDLLLEDGARSWLEGGGVVLEVNGIPQIGGEGSLEPFEQILRETLPELGRIEVHLLISEAERSEPELQEIARKLAKELRCSGYSTRSRVYYEKSILSQNHANGAQAARLLLNEPLLDRALCCLSASEVVEHGLPTNHITSLRILPDGPEGKNKKTLRVC
ncbi:ATP-grasp domain-containing protein [Synechococcus sp. CBW1006]|uniref:ATP-binding protein n=1 Tax=Synechococcus sp. CBW1006 TaxID=1353138 RepID=UPI0018CF7658|nr:ATP-grasp domain-containing protein [Synechococcus sp. CBW1006]QPN67462.1 ATP-grasp domain-containing protein [Synechococcus sp. CBW1006]